MGMLTFLYEKLSRPGTRKHVEGSIYDFRIMDIQGDEINFEAYRGKKLLIVNTASKCGYTPQYDDLEKLHQKYGNSLAILGFPSNDFLWQEPGSNEEILSFCNDNYGVTFKMFSKISVKGRSQHLLYQWLKAKTGKVPTWNFCKYLVSEDGREVIFFSFRVSPLDRAIVSEISNESL